MSNFSLPSAVDLARAQFALTIVWHFLFPAFTIGLTSYLAVLEAFWLRTMSKATSMRRVFWFLALWAGGIIGLMSIALPLRWLLKAV